MANQAANPTAAPYVTGLWPISISGRFARVTNSIGNPGDRGARETAGTKPPHEGEQQHGELQRAAHEANHDERVRQTEVLVRAWRPATSWRSAPPMPAATPKYRAREL
jgi:hypothetical protein